MTMEMEQTNGDDQQQTCPWLIFLLDEVSYGINTAMVQSIMKRPEEIVALPEAPSYIRGVVRIREEVVPVLDLRHLYGLPSAEEEYLEFKQMIDRRKEDHEHWIDALVHSAQTGEAFQLATDPRQCAFGKWYYAFTSDAQQINFMLKKVEAPHRKLHETALEMLRCSQEHEDCMREECLKVTLKKAKEELMPQILNLLDEVKEVFHHRYQEKMIVVENEKRKIAVVVDDVKAIDHLTIAEGQEKFSEMTRNQYIESVGRGTKSEELILMVRAESFLGLVKEGVKYEIPA